METEDWEVISYSDSIIQADDKDGQYRYNTAFQKGEIFNSIKVSLKSMGTNIMKSIEELGSCSLLELINSADEPIFIFGCELNGSHPDVWKKLHSCMEGLQWFSYRKKFPFILSKKNIVYNTDASIIIRLGLYY